MLTKDVWNKSYQNGSTPWRRKTYDFSEWLKLAGINSGSALDLGCGTGEVSMWLSNHGFEVEGIDFSENALEVARQQSKKPDFIQHNLNNLNSYSFNHEKYDLIVDSKVLPFIKDKDKYLSIIQSKLSGVFILHVIVSHDNKNIFIPEKELELLIKPLFKIKEKKVLPTRPGKKVVDYYLVSR